MPQQAHIIAQRLLNLYRQEHVIDGGWAAVNKVFIAESDNEAVIAELENMPTGKKLIAHINNLRTKKTPMDSIDKDLLPYGGLMSGIEVVISLSDSEKKLFCQEQQNEKLRQYVQLSSALQRRFHPLRRDRHNKRTGLRRRRAGA